MTQEESIIEGLAREAEKVFISHNYRGKYSKNMLIIIPDLKLGGTLTVLMEMLSLYDQKGYNIYVISSRDGEYREKLLESCAAIVIRPYVGCTESYKHFLQREFDLILINSAACYYYIYYFINTETRVVWWLHETRTQLKTLKEAFPHLGLLSANIQVAGVTYAVCRGIKELYGVKSVILPMLVADCSKSVVEVSRKDERVVFFIPAAYTFIKGQDILLQAISKLPAEYVEKSSFVFCGYQLPGQAEYYEKIKGIVSLLRNVEFLDELDKEEVYRWYQICDCVIAPSRIDATPTTIVEAMMMKRLCIVSNATGISEYMQDCVNGFVFPSGNVTELLKRIMLVIADNKMTGRLAEEGRKIYEENFSISVVSERLASLL